MNEPKIPQTLGAIVKKVERHEQILSVMQALNKAVNEDPTLRAVQHTGRIAGWVAEETAAYMILCLKARAERAEALLLEYRRNTVTQPLWVGVDRGGE